MRRSDVSSVALFAILSTLPALAVAHGPAGGGGHRGGFSGHVGSFGLAPRLGSPFVPRLGVPAFGSSTPGWGWLGRPNAFGASPSGFVPIPFHAPYAAPFWTGNAASLAMKPDEETVLQSESRMEEQIRSLENAPKDESSEKDQDAAPNEDGGEWQPL